MKFAASLLAICLGLEALSAHAQSPDFNRYAVPKYQGPRAAPDFSGPQKRFSTYRSAIRFGYPRGELVAGHFVRVQIGCGTRCVNNYFVDARNGSILQFPVGGEDYPELTFDSTAESRLIVAKWADPHDPFNAPHHCFVRQYLLEGLAFVQLGREVRLSQGCENF